MCKLDKNQVTKKLTEYGARSILPKVKQKT